MPVEHIDSIEEIRRANNSFWMNILRIAFIHAPDATISEMKQIVAGDKAVTKQFQDMIDAYEDSINPDRSDPDAVYCR